MNAAQAISVLQRNFKALRFVNGIQAAEMEQAFSVLVPPAQHELLFHDGPDGDHSQARQRVFDALRKARGNGLTSADLNEICFRFGARIWELRHGDPEEERESVEIFKKREGKIFRYFLHERHW